MSSLCGLTLWQPFASLVACGAKTIETRSWPTRYRGPLAIHAARKWDADTAEDCQALMETLAGVAFAPPSPAHATAGNLPWRETLGCILAVAELVDCRAMMQAPDRLNGLFGIFGDGRWGWVLANVQPVLPPIPCRGFQGLWGVPSEVAECLAERGALFGG